MDLIQVNRVNTMRMRWKYERKIHYQMPKHDDAA